jgi:glutamate/tyrosine decarboxylase-like PLP-dependent enzyme
MEYPDQYTIHETEEHRKRQKETLVAVIASFNKKVKSEEDRIKGKLTRHLSEQDAQFFKGGKYVALVEAKYRENPIDKYSDYTIDVDKIDSLIKRATEDGVQGLLVVSWLGDIRYANLTKVAKAWDREDDLFSISRQKRKDRQELADKVYHIPHSLFKKLA